MERVEENYGTYVPAMTLKPLEQVVEKRTPPTVAAPNFINDVAAGRVELPTIPHIVQRLLVVLRDPDSDNREISETLLKDPILSAKVLRLANSALFGGRRSVATVHAAIAIVGMQAVNRLVMACGVSSAFSEVPGVDLASFWRDALRTAKAAQSLAPHCGADPHEAYLCGLLHGTGHLILCQTYPEIASFVFAGFEPVRGAELAAIEVESFGIDHASVTALWIDTIGFPQTVIDAVRQSPRPYADSDNALDRSLRAACTIAAAIAGEVEAATLWSALPPSICEQFGGTAEEPGAAFTDLYHDLTQEEPTM
ncbi:MAG: HDOD domain-containing protein [Variovorax sp.]